LVCNLDNQVGSKHRGRHHQRSHHPSPSGLCQEVQYPCQS
jgi:hypothetical protein